MPSASASAMAALLGGDDGDLRRARQSIWRRISGSDALADAAEAEDDDAAGKLDVFLAERHRGVLPKRSTESAGRKSFSDRERAPNG